MIKYLIMASIVLSFSAVQAKKKDDKKAAREPQSQTIRESKNEKYQILGLVHKVHRMSVSPFGQTGEAATISVFEMIGGDPAMNGNIIYMAICPESPVQACAYFPNVLDLSGIRTVSVDTAQKSIIISGSEEYLTHEGQIKNEKITYGVRYDWKSDGSVKEILTTYKIK